MRLFIISKRQVNIFLLFFALIFLSTAYTALLNSNVLNVFKKDDRIIPIYCVDTEEKKIAISFDAAWGADFTEELLSILKQYNIKTTFFLVAFWVDKYPEMVKRIDEEGH